MTKLLSYLILSISAVSSPVRLELVILSTISSGPWPGEIDSSARKYACRSGIPNSGIPVDFFLIYERNTQVNAHLKNLCPFSLTVRITSSFQVFVPRF